MKCITVFFIVLFLNANAQKAELTLSGSIFNSPTDSLYIAQLFNQGEYKYYDTIILDEKGNFSTSITLPKQDYYIAKIGTSELHLVVREKNDIKICKRFL